jgi:predicted RNA-binding Zn ribbon-like protein
LYARASDERLPDRARRRLNLISSSGPISTALTRDGEVIEEIASADAYRRFEVAIARSAIELADRKRDGLQVCGAPSCGMLFLRDHPRQTWCSKACGNRARVARHAARQRRHRREEPGPLRQPAR